MLGNKAVRGLCICNMPFVLILLSVKNKSPNKEFDLKWDFEFPDGFVQNEPISIRRIGEELIIGFIWENTP